MSDAKGLVKNPVEATGAGKSGGGKRENVETWPASEGRDVKTGGGRHDARGHLRAWLDSRILWPSINTSNYPSR